MRYSLFSKIGFYASLIWFNLLSPLECKNHRFKILVNEFIYLFITLGWKRRTPEHKSTVFLKTRFGNFVTRDTYIDLKIASPSYERLDLNELMRRIYASLVLTRRVLFIDIGASFGKYTVAIGNQFRKYAKQLTILSFEPDYESYMLLKKNIKLNHLVNTKAFQIALSNKSGRRKFYYYAPMKQVVSFHTEKNMYLGTSTLDSFQDYTPKGKNIDVFIKLDIEGHEALALRGARSVIDRYTNIYLLIEDSVSITSKNLLQYLLSHGDFLSKKTVYNSFWKLYS